MTPEVQKSPLISKNQSMSLSKSTGKLLQEKKTNPVKVSKSPPLKKSSNTMGYASLTRARAATIATNVPSPLACNFNILLFF